MGRNSIFSRSLSGLLAIACLLAAVPSFPAAAGITHGNPVPEILYSDSGAVVENPITDTDLDNFLISLKYGSTEEDFGDTLFLRDVQINLYCNGCFLKSGKAGKESGWKYSFTDLPRNQSGARIRYTVGQSDVPGYDKSVNGLIITNTIRKSAKHDTESETEAGKNSGSRNLSLLPLFLIGIPGIVILIALRNHQKSTR